MGRFTVQDPIRLAGGMNLNAYGPNPSGGIDPLRLSACSGNGKNDDDILGPHGTLKNDTRPGQSHHLNQDAAIGDDPGGNYFVLVCNKSQKGIYYWDRTHLHIEDEIQDFSIPEVNDSGNLYKIHNEFSEFLTILTKKTLDKGMALNKNF